MKNLYSFLPVLIVVVLIVLIFYMIVVNNKDNIEHDIKMAQAGLEQCKPHWMNQQVIWVRDCKQILEK